MGKQINRAGEATTTTPGQDTMLAVLAAALAGLVLAAAGLLAQRGAPAEAAPCTPQAPPVPYER